MIFIRSFFKMWHTSISLIRLYPHALVIAVVVFVFMTFLMLLQSFTLLFSVLGDISISHFSKLIIIFGLYGDLVTSNGIISFTMILITSILLGIQVLFTTFYIKKMSRGTKRSLTIGVPGVVSGLLGMGCASCGFLLPIFPTVLGVSSLFTVLPFDGREFSILSIILLVIANSILVKRLSQSMVCMAR